jgi:hypothetical protein
VINEYILFGNGQRETVKAWETISWPALLMALATLLLFMMLHLFHLPLQTWYQLNMPQKWGALPSFRKTIVGLSLTTQWSCRQQNKAVHLSSTGHQSKLACYALRSPLLRHHNQIKLYGTGALDTLAGIAWPG